MCYPVDNTFSRLDSRPPFFLNILAFLNSAFIRAGSAFNRKNTELLSRFFKLLANQGADKQHFHVTNITLSPLGLYCFRIDDNCTVHLTSSVRVSLPSLRYFSLTTSTKYLASRFSAKYREKIYPRIFFLTARLT